MTVLLLSELKGYCQLAGWSGDDLNTAVAIAMAENHALDSDAEHKNADGSIDYGIFQLNSIHNLSDDEKHDPWKNIQKAHDIYVAAGNSFSPWVTYKNGAYKDNLDAARNASSSAPGGPEANVQQNPPSFDPLAGIAQAFTRGVSSLLTVAIALTLIALGIGIVFREPLGKAASRTAGVAAKAAIL